MPTLVPLVVALAVAQAPAQSPAPASPQNAAPAPEGVAPAAAPGAVTVLTLDEALVLAERQNLDLKAAEARLRQAQEATWKAWSGYLPQAAVNGSYTRNPDTVEFQAQFGTPEAPQTVEFTVLPQNQLAGSVDVSQMIFSPALWFGIRAAKSGVDAAELATAGARRDILFATAQAYYAVASLRSAVEVGEQLLEIAQRQEKDARVRFQAGTIAKVGQLRAEIDRARAEQDLRRTRNNYESARIGLALLLDRPVDFEVAVPPEPQLVADAAQLEATAAQERTEVRAARRQLDSARSARSAQIGRYFPNLAAFGRWQVQNYAGFTGSEDSWAAGLALSWQLLDGGLRESDVREAGARIDEAEVNVANVESRVRAEVRQAVLDLESARANATKAREQRELAAENQRLVDVSYRAGAATAVEQADAVAQLRNAEIGQLTETLSAQLAALRVLRAAGAPLRGSAAKN
jgi:outer membrane protein TolC